MLASWLIVDFKSTDYKCHSLYLIMKLPELFLDTFHFRIDPTWHEFESIEYTDEASNAAIDLTEFIGAVKKTKQSWS